MTWSRSPQCGDPQEHGHEGGRAGVQKAQLARQGVHPAVGRLPAPQEVGAQVETSPHDEEGGLLRR